MLPDLDHFKNGNDMGQTTNYWLRPGSHGEQAIISFQQMPALDV